MTKILFFQHFSQVIVLVFFLSLRPSSFFSTSSKPLRRQKAHDARLRRDVVYIKQNPEGISRRWLKSARWGSSIQAILRIHSGWCHWNLPQKMPRDKETLRGWVSSRQMLLVLRNNANSASRVKPAFVHVRSSQNLQQLIAFHSRSVCEILSKKVPS